MNENAVDEADTNANERDTEVTNNLSEIENKTEQKQETEKQESTIQESTDSTDKSQQLKSSKLVSDEYVNFVLGDSNALRIHVKDPDVKNVSKSGQKAADIKTMLDMAGAESSTNNKIVKRIVVHLGTNDVSKHKTDAAQVQLELATALSETHKKFPDASIAFSSILPRRGKSTATALLNNTAKNCK